MINKHKSNKIKENSNTVRHLNNGTDHRHSKSCCDQSSPARRTTKQPQFRDMTHITFYIWCSEAQMYKAEVLEVFTKSLKMKLKEIKRNISWLFANSKSVDMWRMTLRNKSTNAIFMNLLRFSYQCNLMMTDKANHSMVLHVTALIHPQAYTSCRYVSEH